ncbi:hypothetical protein GCM10008927_03430 [Amylibacter ulvae]|uniref:Uncharacterized protein n=1 Tax=Paramylibacter ulvae TaxID=1651968 RepID=A0ABQ3CT80_9RHOB|nr:hypothetical protein [Amylibacter ulvae]GHA42283.1 hypothetical protein GCM10008927_03430 [Amylibacter ulvae]
MVFKGNLDIDPRGMIYESFRIENITVEECRVIFLDWAMFAPSGEMKDQLGQFITEYGDQYPDHPMMTVIKEGLEKSPTKGRRGGRMGRRNL